MTTMTSFYYPGRPFKVTALISSSGERYPLTEKGRHVIPMGRCPRRKLKALMKEFQSKNDPISSLPTPGETQPPADNFEDPLFQESQHSVWDGSAGFEDWFTATEIDPF
jgi:hypothetical protein